VGLSGPLEDLDPESKELLLETFQNTPSWVAKVRCLAAGTPCSDRRLRNNTRWHHLLIAVEELLVGLGSREAGKMVRIPPV
jgi:hypothetical protein